MNEPVLTIVVEGHSDVELVRALLGEELATRVRFFVGQGKLSLASLARNILVDDGGPVLVVMDADTTNQQKADEEKGMVRLALSRVASPSDYGVFLFTPAIEVVLFEAPEALRELLHRDTTAATLRDGLLIPKATLKTLRGDATAMNGRISPHVGELLAASKQAGAFREAVQRLMEQHAAA
jgi:hypothetical protein